MNISATSAITLKAVVTPADKWASSTYNLGPDNQTIVIPSAADVIVTAQLDTASGVSRDYELDSHTWNSSAMLDPDGNSVSLDTVYGIVLYNEDSSLSAEFLATNFGSQPWAGLLQAGAYAYVNFPAGVTVGSTSTIGITGLSGSPNIRLVLIGESA